MRKKNFERDIVSPITLILYSLFSTFTTVNCHCTFSRRLYLVSNKSFSIQNWRTHTYTYTHLHTYTPTPTQTTTGPWCCFCLRLMQLIFHDSIRVTQTSSKQRAQTSIDKEILDAKNQFYMRTSDLLAENLCNIFYWQVHHKHHNKVLTGFFLICLWKLTFVSIKYSLVFAITMQCYYCECNQLLSSEKEQPTNFSGPSFIPSDIWCWKDWFLVELLL